MRILREAVAATVAAASATTVVPAATAATGIQDDRQPEALRRRETDQSAGIQQDRGAAPRVPDTSHHSTRQCVSVSTGYPIPFDYHPCLYRNQGTRSRTTAVKIHSIERVCSSRNVPPRILFGNIIQIESIFYTNHTHLAFRQSVQSPTHLVDVPNIVRFIIFFLLIDISLPTSQAELLCVNATQILRFNLFGLSDDVTGM